MDERVHKEHTVKFRQIEYPCCFMPSFFHFSSVAPMSGLCGHSIFQASQTHIKHCNALV